MIIPRMEYPVVWQMVKSATWQSSMFLLNSFQILFLLFFLLLNSVFSLLASVTFNTWDRGMDCLGRRRVILDREGNHPYLVRYYLLFRHDTSGDSHIERPAFNLFIHHILKSDEEDLHDHPWSYFTCILAGGYWETVGKLATDGGNDTIAKIESVRHWRRPGFMQRVPSDHTHRLELEKDEITNLELPCWTLFVHFKRTRPWGFYIQNNGEVEWETSIIFVARKVNRLSMVTIQQMM